MNRVKILCELGETEGWRCHYCHSRLIPCGQEEDICNVFYLPEGWGGGMVKSYAAPQGYGWPQVDHKVPRSRGGTDLIENLVMACLECNSRKGSRYTYEQFYRMTEAFRKGEE